ncbi:hypothetical protein EBU71_14400 [bacterium]|nr:hypothetical protein [Candidatus Elulimicrobium humile]
MLSNNLLESLLDNEPSFGAESSFNFLRFYQFYYDWNVYDSNTFGFENVNTLVNTFVSLHGRVNISSKENSNLSIYSAQPLGLFKYKMNEQNQWKELGYLNKQIGYLVEGAYWNNGFFYRVLDKNVIIESKLYIDDRTLISYSYPETKRVSDCSSLYS